MFHDDLADRWNNFTIFEQMANVGAEAGRAMKWKRKGKEEYYKNATYRFLELIDFTIADPKNKNSLKELLRIREVFLDYIFGDNIYKSTDEAWEKYFYYFNFAARR